MSDESNQTVVNSEQAMPVGQPLRDPSRVPVRATPGQSPVQSRSVQTAERPVNIRRDQNTGNREPRFSNLGEYLKFGILAIVLLATPLVIFLLIPFIFGQIVPTVLGSNSPTAIPGMPGDQVVEPDTAGTPAILSPGGPETGIGGEGTPVTTPTIQQPNAAGDLVHVVQSGDTLASIGRLYGVTAEEIAAANNIANPNEIYVGSILIIPTNE